MLGDHELREAEQSKQSTHRLTDNLTRQSVIPESARRKCFSSSPSPMTEAPALDEKHRNRSSELIIDDVVS